MKHIVWSVLIIIGLSGGELRAGTTCQQCTFPTTPCAPDCSTTLVDNGPSSKRIDVVFVPCNYDDSSPTWEAEFQSFAASAVTQFQITSPFREYFSYFNFHAVFSGNPLDAPEADEIIYLNAEIPTSGAPSCATLPSAPNGGQSWVSLIQHVTHEAAHSFNSGLGDEYTWDWDLLMEGPPYMGPPDAYDIYPNILADYQVGMFGTIKWVDWIDGPALTCASPCGPQAGCTPIPTDPCWIYPPFEPQVGLYDGAGYHVSGVFRSSETCRMRTVAPFCNVCSDALITSSTRTTTSTSSMARRRPPVTLPSPPTRRC